MRKVFQIPVSWEMYGYIEVESDSLEKAIKFFDIIEEVEGYPLPEGEYVDGSFNRETLEFCKEFNIKLDE